MNTNAPPFQQLHDDIGSFLRGPLDPSSRDVRFGHLSLPHNHWARINIGAQIIDSIHRTDRSMGIALVLSPVELELIDGDYDGLPEDAGPFNFKAIDYSRCLHILRSNRETPGGQGPAAWKNEPQPEGWNEDNVCPDRMIFVLSLDLSLRADCALALIGLVQWALDVSHRWTSKIRLLTVSSCLNNNLLSALVRLREDFPVAHFDFDSNDLDPPSPDAIVHAPLSWVPRWVSNVMRDADLGSRHAILYVPTSDFSTLLGMTLNERSPLSAVFSWLGQGEHFTFAGPILERLRCQIPEDAPESRAMIIDVDPEFPIPGFLDGFTHAHIVLGTESWGILFDATSRQLVSTMYELTADERHAMQWWCQQPNIPEDNLHIYAGPDGLEGYLDAAPSRRRVHVENTQAGGFIAAVFDMAPWGLDPARVLPYFIHSSLVLQEMSNRLFAQGIIQAAPQQLALRGRQVTTFRAVLPHTQYDHRLAYFIALDSSNSTVLSIKLQVATLLMILPTHRIQINADVLPLADLVQTCWGYGRGLASTGYLWMMLGLWKRLALEHGEFNFPEHFQYEVGITLMAAQGGIQVNSIAARLFRHFLWELKEDFSVEELPEVSIAEEMDDLTEAQVTELQQHLLLAFIHQLVLTNRVSDTELEHTIVATGTKLVRVESGPDHLGVATVDRLGKNGTLFGFCTSLFRIEGGHLVGKGWTWIPSDVVTEWKDLHAPSQTLSEALASGVRQGL
ncbi:uncharacterized protein NECHADRAFT_83320 [Fusarium vanettenii 77-13-4]|uniref:Uncharacterized protein n=1 Tax=Fusarium vanettenii (strain ATCC MYA-4622 / CBS 123669 / FGSC 9596 / NRRL 45880 / 77-13-4) TaxID=660122 RepID=C7Z3P2_FUSV7|nr:uncharacterized protein NECHADRAFT_83320 [Fusarium vanettenii 77-13-4]EEU41172.1 predicted protein [Fusarium vanettenii 77-13-4]